MMAVSSPARIRRQASCCRSFRQRGIRRSQTLGGNKNTKTPRLPRLRPAAGLPFISRLLISGYSRPTRRLAAVGTLDPECLPQTRRLVRMRPPWPSPGAARPAAGDVGQLFCPPVRDARNALRINAGDLRIDGQVVGMRSTLSRGHQKVTIFDQDGYRRHRDRASVGKITGGRIASVG